MSTTKLSVDKYAILNSSEISSVFKFNRITDAIQYAVNHGVHVLTIDIGIGDYSADVINIPQNLCITMQGPVAGLCSLGPINWTVSGGLQAGFPIVSSALVTRSVSINGNLTIIDGSPPATLAVFVAENTVWFPTGNIVQTGTSNIAMSISGITAANELTNNFFVSSQVNGNVNCPSCGITLTNTLIDGYTIASSLYATDSAFDGYQNGANIQVSNPLAQVMQSVLSPPSTVKFTGSAGTLYTDTDNIAVINGSYINITNPHNTTVVNVNDADIALTKQQLNCQCLTFTGIISTNRTITFPNVGYWNLDCTQVAGIKHNQNLNLSYQSNTASISSSGLYQVSITTSGVTVK